MGFLDYRKQEVRNLGINPSDCSFNPGVFVADIREWKKQKITKQLEKWMEENFRCVQKIMTVTVTIPDTVDCTSLLPAIQFQLSYSIALR